MEGRVDRRHHGLLPRPGQRPRPPGERLWLGGVLGRGGGVAASARGVPDQDCRFGLLQPPPFGLFTAMVVPAQRTASALAFPAAELGEHLPVLRYRTRTAPTPWAVYRPSMVFVGSND